MSFTVSPKEEPPMVQPQAQDNAFFKEKLPLAPEIVLKIKEIDQESCSEKTNNEQFWSTAEVAALGPIFKSSKPVQISEPESDYSVYFVKHTFAKRFVFQFFCYHSCHDRILENVCIRINPTGRPHWCVVSSWPIANLSFGQICSFYALLKFSKHAVSDNGKFTCSMEFVVKKCDPIIGEFPGCCEGYNDNLSLGDVEIAMADHLKQTKETNFQVCWDKLNDVAERECLFDWRWMKSIDEAEKDFERKNWNCLAVCGRSETIVEGKTNLTLSLCGVFRNGVRIFAKANFSWNRLDTLYMTFTVRSTDPIITDVVAALYYK